MALTTPNVVGQPFTTAQQQLAAVGLAAAQGATRVSEQVQGTLLASEPGPQQVVALGRTVVLDINGGPGNVVPAPVSGAGGPPAPAAHDDAAKKAEEQQREAAKKN